MVPFYRYLLPFILFFPLSVFAQSGRDTVFLEGLIESNLTLSPEKLYIVRHNVKVVKGTTLTIPAKTKLYFNFKTAIAVEGGLNMNGSPDGMIEVTSSNPAAPGYGILVRGAGPEDINIKYTKFSRISYPVRFEVGWFRENVNIQNNAFTEILTGEPIITIVNPSTLADVTGGKKATLVFSNNSYTGNWGGIYIDNFQSDVLDLQFTDNLLTNNVVYAVKQGDPTNALIYGVFDNVKSKHETKFSGNAIFGNYQINSAVDTIIREVGIGIYGSGEVFNIPGNFFRSTDPAYISSTFDHFYQNEELPLLQIEPVAPAPGEALPPHIWKVKINNRDLDTYAKLPPLANRDLPMEVFFNKPVEATGDYQLESFVFDQDSNLILIQPLEIKDGQWSPDHMRYSFKVDNASFLNAEAGYMILSNFEDANGRKVPKFSIGQQHSLNTTNRVQVSVDDMKTIKIVTSPDDFSGFANKPIKGQPLTPEDIKIINEILSQEELSELLTDNLVKSWEVGIQIGASNYSGTMTDRFTRRSEYHFAGGIYGQYNAHKWFSLRAMLWYGQISGNDLSVSSLATRQRGHNFKNYIVEGSFTFHWHLLSYGTNRGERFVPSIFTGLAVYSQSPRSRVFLTLDQAGDPVYLRWYDGHIATDWKNNTDGYHDGKDIWIPVRPIGTEGQTVKDKTDPEANSGSEDAPFFQGREAPRQYRITQFSIPLGLEMNWIIRSSWNIGATFGVRLTTNSYLDDLGGYYFDRINDHQAIVDANMGSIKGRTRKERGLNIPDQITFINDQNLVTTRNTAAILANASYASEDPNNYAYSINQPYDNHDARRAGENFDNYDFYFFAGVKVTKILKREKEDKKKDDAFENDTDGDGLSDEEEKKLGTNAKSADSDGDGLSDKKEQEAGTSATKKDSDGDGIIDGKDQCPTIAGLKEANGCPKSN